MSLTPQYPIVPALFTCRPASASDAPAMSALFFESFNASFWKYAMPPTTATREWWKKAWLLGIEEDPTARTFVVFDPSVKSGEDPEGKLVAFARWILPQSDGSLDRLWPELPGEWDLSVMGPFFKGMGENRAALMDKRPHWTVYWPRFRAPSQEKYRAIIELPSMLEMLGTHEDYQGRGIGSGLVKWGCDLADSENLEVYLDASERGAPVYQKHFAFEPKKQIPLLEKPPYGKFVYISHVRPVQTKA